MAVWTSLAKLFGSSIPSFVVHDKTMAGNLSPEETKAQRRAELTRGFTVWETKHFGLGLSDLGRLMRQEGYAPTEAQLQVFTKGAPGEKLPLEYFTKCCEEVGYDDPSVAELASFFEPFDPKGTGFVSSATFRRIMEGMGETFSSAEVDTMLDDFCAESAEKVNYKDFVFWVTQR